MSKKISTSLYNIEYPKPASCSVCKCVSAAAILYVCKSGHVVCEKCHYCDDKNEGHQKGSIHKKKYVQSCCNDFKNTRIKNLACGDHEHYDNKTTIQYKNVHYSDSKSSLHSAPSLIGQRSHDNGIEYENKPIPRPVTCPDCDKMVSMNTILLHFQFDHPKVLRITLYSNAAQSIKLDISSITTKSRCIALFLKESQSRLDEVTSSAFIESTYYENCPLMLMAAKINKIAKQNVTTNDAFTQTENENNNIQQNILVIKKLKSVLSVKRIEQCKLDINEHLIFWLCKLGDDDNIYNIMISRDDKKFSYAYTGEAIDIRENQSALAVFNNRSEYLLANNTAVHKLINENQIKISVTMNTFK